MNYTKYFNQFANTFLQLFKNNENMTLEQLERAYESLINEYPHFYVITWNNQNFLFLDNFYYSENLLNFLSKKIDLNFIDSRLEQSALFYHLKKEMDFSSVPKSIESKDRVFFILDTDTNQDIEEKKKILTLQFKNYHNFLKFNVSEYSKSNKYQLQPSYHVSHYIVDRFKSFIAEVDKDKIDWKRTSDLIWRDIFRLHTFKQSDLYGKSTSTSSQATGRGAMLSLLELMIDLPVNNSLSIEKKEQLFDIIKTYDSGQKINWSKKINSNYLAYQLISQLTEIPPHRVEPQSVEKYYLFLKKIIFDDILSSGFSFHNIYSYHHGECSLYHMIEKYWLPNMSSTSGTVATNSFERRLKKEIIEHGPVFEERAALESQSSTKAHSVIKINDYKL